MEQYLDLLRKIKKKGTLKTAAREGMPGTISLFGPQMEFDLADGFPILTTKKINFKHIVTELLWFLNGDTNIKYLVDNGCNIWNEDSYNYYLKKCREQNIEATHFENFIAIIKDGGIPYGHPIIKNYNFGDCGYQYGKVWRGWSTGKDKLIKNGQTYPSGEFMYDKVDVTIDQIKNVLNSLRNNPESRRHIVTAIDPAHDEDLALYWCHSMFQFNVRPIGSNQRRDMAFQGNYGYNRELDKGKENEGLEEYWTRINKILDYLGVPKYHLDCQMYQRSADVFLGVPYNISSYALLTHIMAKLTNMIPGEFIHTFGDVHIYENHMEQVDEILTRTPDILPKLVMTNDLPLWKGILAEGTDLELSFEAFTTKDFKLENYNPQASIKAKLSTGLK